MDTTSSHLKEVRFQNPRLNALGVEVLSLDSFRRRVSAAHLAAPQRVEFLMLLFVASGYLRHDVDFSELRLGAGSLAFVQPGQVQQWHVDGRCEGCMVMIDPPALKPISSSVGHHDVLLNAMADWPVGVRLDDGFASDLRSAFHRISCDVDGFDGTLHDVTLIQQGLLAVLLRVARWHRKRQSEGSSGPSPIRQVHKLFQSAIDRHFREHLPVSEYARRLGYSESTLNRASRLATGKSAKVLLDRRLSMEASRMLVHTDAAVADIAHSLGFTESTNFIRFFVRMVGMTPSRFRSRHSDTALKGDEMRRGEVGG